MNEENLVYRLRKRAEIRRQIPSRKSVQENKPDRIADLLDEAATEIERLSTVRVAQPVPEPVATQYKYIDAHGKDYWTSEPWEGKKVEDTRYLYASPQNDIIDILRDQRTILVEALEQIFDLPEDSRIHYKIARKALAKVTGEEDDI